MKQWLFRLSVTGALLLFAGVASAALTNISGSVTKFEPGKSISVKDSKTGTTQTLSLSHDTTVQGDIKIGSQVSIEADGNKARVVTAMAQAPGMNPTGPPPGSKEPDPLGGGSAGSPSPESMNPDGSRSGTSPR